MSIFIVGDELIYGSMLISYHLLFDIFDFDEFNRQVFINFQDDMILLYRGALFSS